jgi:hypothetical protein
MKHFKGGAGYKSLGTSDKREECTYGFRTFESKMLSRILGPE